ncbi:MAG: dihydroneopterin aldolase, partial [Bacteroidales bacterium]|nr:dihydroneopterin aldolase [Bacteroidales bacterium]
MIKIEGMEFYAFHGHYKEEQIVGNRFLVDLEMETDMAVP